MIVNFKKKFIFVGLPFSATSAISKELLERYGCDTLLHKHASIPALIAARPDIDIAAFEIIAVVRDPVETSLTLYHWLKDNRYKHFTKQENFIENGGSIPKKYRKLCLVIQKKNMTFEQYLDHCFKMVPYDGLLSENIEFLTKVIRYEKLQDDFKSCLRDVGLEVDREIPGYNKTENKFELYNLDRSKLTRYFGPYLRYNARFYQDANSFKNIDVNTISPIDTFKFYILRRMKSYYRLYLDLRLMKNNLSHID